VPLHSRHGVLHWACQPRPPHDERDTVTSVDELISRPSSLNRRDFFAAVVADARANLPPELARFRHRANPMLLKLDYGNDRIHFEVWPDGARGRVEIGLHFEDGPASTMAYLAFFDQRIVEIKHLLGPQTVATTCQKMRYVTDRCGGERPGRTSRAAARLPSMLPNLVRKMRAGIYRFMLLRPVL
jgi:hypothetical protein